MFANHAQLGLHPSGPTSSGERPAAPGGSGAAARGEGPPADPAAAIGTAPGGQGHRPGGLPPHGGQDGAHRGAPRHGPSGLRGAGARRRLAIALWRNPGRSLRFPAGLC